jgi:hypothetical protein
LFHDSWGTEESLKEKKALKPHFLTGQKKNFEAPFSHGPNVGVRASKYGGERNLPLLDSWGVLTLSSSRGFEKRQILER